MTRLRAAAGPISAGVDVVSACVASVCLVARALTASVLRTRATGRSQTLMTLDPDYSLATIRSRGLEHILTAADLDRFFGHVWTVHPLVGAAPNDSATELAGGPSHVGVNERHTVVESGISYSLRLRRWPALNFVLAQALLARDLDELIRRERIGVIRASEPFYLGLLALLLCRANGIPLVVRLIANYDGPYWARGRPVYPRLFRLRSIEKRVDRFVLQRADLVAAGNEDILGYALANGAREDRSAVMLIGSTIDPLHFREPSDDQRSAVMDKRLHRRPLLICVTRLEEPKHPEDVVLVLAEARKHVPELAGVLVGDGSMRPQLEAMIQDLGLQDDMVLAGNRDQSWIADALRSATVVLSPLTGRALVEAALSGTVIVAYEVDWHSEIVRSGETGLLVPYRDTAAMARAVCEMIVDPGRAAHLGAQARTLALDMMDPTRLAKDERAAYERLLQL